MSSAPRRRWFRRSHRAAGGWTLPVPTCTVPTITVIIPALNEAKNLPHVFGLLPEVDEVILVDGGSVDNTVAVARELRPDIRVVTQTRRGKGNALACGFAAATGDIIVMIDADGSMDPTEISRYVAALTAGAHFVKGSRFAPEGGSADITLFRRVGNHALNALVNLLFRARFSDLCYGYMAFWRDCLDVFPLDTDTPAPADGSKLWGDGFEIETLLNLYAIRAGLAVQEVWSFEHRRIHGTTNLNTIRDGFRVLRTIAREWPRKRPNARLHRAPWTVPSQPRVAPAPAAGAATHQPRMSPVAAALLPIVPAQVNVGINVPQSSLAGQRTGTAR